MEETMVISKKVYSNTYCSVAIDLLWKLPTTLRENSSILLFQVSRNSNILTIGRSEGCVCPDKLMLCAIDHYLFPVQWK